MAQRFFDWSLFPFGEFSKDLQQQVAKNRHGELVDSYLVDLFLGKSVVGEGDISVSAVAFDVSHYRDVVARFDDQAESRFESIYFRSQVWLRVGIVEGLIVGFDNLFAQGAQFGHFLRPIDTAGQVEDMKGFEWLNLCRHRLAMAVF